MNYESYKCDPPELKLPEPELVDCSTCGQEGYKYYYDRCQACGKLLCVHCLKKHLKCEG